MHEAALKQAANLQEIELEKARTELELLKGKGKGTPADITVEAEPGEITPEALSTLPPPRSVYPLDYSDP
jgi:hypothetical protein